MSSPFSARTAVVGAALSALMLALLLAPAARPDQLPAVFELQPIVVANGVATIAGSIGGTSVASSELDLNGRRVGLDASGHFTGVVPVADGGVVDLVLRLGDGASSQLKIAVPPTLFGLIDPATDALQQAVSSLTVPPGGFKVVDGKPLTVGGRLLDRNDVVSLTVNGADVLSQLSSDNSYTIQLPGTTRTVTVAARNAAGATRTDTYRVAAGTTRTQTARSTKASTTSVAAAQAVGVKIARVRYVAKRIVRTHRLRMIVTVRDSRGLLVRGATVLIRPTKARWTLRRQQTKRTGRIGTANFVIPIRKRALGRRIVIVATARTPTAHARKATSVRLPRPKPHV